VRCLSRSSFQGWGGAGGKQVPLGLAPVRNDKPEEVDSATLKVSAKEEPPGTGGSSFLHVFCKRGALVSHP
jgi:hypothetical protein